MHIAETLRLLDVVLSELHIPELTQLTSDGIARIANLFKEKPIMYAILSKKDEDCIVENTILGSKAKTKAFLALHNVRKEQNDLEYGIPKLENMSAWVAEINNPETNLLWAAKDVFYRYDDEFDINICYYSPRQ